jgi:hypothetical protein
MPRMIDPNAVAASWFLWILGASFLVAFAVPLLVMPLRWARLFGWTARREPLTLYFGRCLGGVAIANCVISMRLAPSISAHPVWLEFIAVSGAGLAIAHVVGAVEGEQPWIETAEIVLFAGAEAAAAGLRIAM